MVKLYTMSNGGEVHGPPYTEEEENAFYEEFDPKGPIVLLHQRQAQAAKPQPEDPPQEPEE